MHLVVPFAAPLLPPPAAGPGGAAQGGPGSPLAALRAVAALPGVAALAALLAGRAPDLLDAGDEWSLSPPHERVLARAWGLPAGGDGQLPFAAARAQQDGIATGTLAWGLLTPAHWRLGTEQLSLLDPAELALDAAGSRAFFEAIRGLFESEGFTVAWGAPARWYVAHESLAALPTASVDRVVNRNVDRWLDPHPAARRVRRLQAEVQMLLQDHPLNAAREAQGLPVLNSFWLSGCGALPQPAPWPPGLVVDERLRGPALAEDWAAWQQAWAALAAPDGGPLAALRAEAEAGRSPCISLCGERSALTATLRPRGWRQRLAGVLARPDALRLLEAL